MFAPAPVAALSLSWAYVTAALTAVPVIRAGQNLGAAWRVARSPSIFPAFPESHNPYISHPTIKKEGV